jgi:hypothetical protein
VTTPVEVQIVQLNVRGYRASCPTALIGLGLLIVTEKLVA